jgi:hypothetical protein
LLVLALLLLIMLGQTPSEELILPPLSRSDLLLLPPLILIFPHPTLHPPPAIFTM